LLSTFDFYQTGDRIRIVDADGSVYEGSVIADKNLNWDQVKNRRDEPAKVPQVGSQNQRDVLFRVTGTNRTANQLVILNATFQSASPAARMTGLSAEKTSDTAPLAVAQSPRALSEVASGPASAPARGSYLQLPASVAISGAATARIHGKARMGNGQEIQIEAVPAAP